jgi:regulatory protein
MPDSLEDKKDILIKLESYCAYQERCINDVLQKAKSLGANDIDAKDLLQQLQATNFQNEERFAEAYVQGKLKINRWGRQKIKAALSQKFVNTTIIQNALFAIDEEVYGEIAQQLVLKKSNDLKTEKNTNLRKQKIIRFLMSRGFNYEEFASNEADEGEAEDCCWNPHLRSCGAGGRRGASACNATRV